MRFIALIILFMFAAPVMAAESPVVTGDPGTSAIAGQEPPIQPNETPATPPLAPPPAELLAPVNAVPDGVRYTIATEAENTRAYQKIKAALAATPHDFRSLMPTDGETTSYTGIFMALHDMDGQKAKMKLMNTVTYKILFSDIVTKEVTGYGAKTAQQLEMLAAAYMENIKISGDYKIRKLMPEEMAVIWYSSARDIFEPAYVVEDGGHKYVFLMSHDGETLDFFEDLGRPCFNAMGAQTRIDETGAEVPNENYMPCKCFATTQDGLKYTVVFKSCPSKE